MRKYFFILFVLFLISCESNENKAEKKVETIPVSEKPILDLAQAEKLAAFAFHCIDTEYPNKLNQTIGDASYLKEPKDLHPIFYGCFDWHSAVHGHWSLVRLLKKYPELKDSKAIRQKLDLHFTAENVQKELAYFEDKHNRNYERTYGWVWLLKLAEELYLWDDPDGKRWSKIMEPYANFIVGKYLEFLPKLDYPIRIGEHSNTAFGMSYAWDYANTVGHAELKNLIEDRAKDYYLKDVNCPATWEPGGFDFLSPCLEEANIMRRVLDQEAFNNWLEKFLPEITQSFSPVDVTDRTDGKMVHLDGLNFSRAWCLYGMAKTSGDPDITNLANAHLNYSLNKIKSGSYAGEHWLASFAIYALSESE